MVGTKILSLEVSEYCNLDCKHCMNGKCANVYMSDDVIRAVFKNINVVEELLLTGGEVFLCYERVKRILEIAREEGANILSCSIVTNACVYDERIYELLDEYFGDEYVVHISNDDYHDKSIMRTYQGTEVSKNPELAPSTIEEVRANMLKHMERDSFGEFKELGSRLINVGRAKNIEGSKHPFEVMGYFYQEFPKYFLLGPVVFVSATGEVCEGNDEIDRYKEHSIGNILEEDIKTMVRRGGIGKKYDDPDDFFHFLEKRMHDYDTLAGPHYHIIDGRMVEVEIVRDNRYKEEMQRFIQFLQEAPVTTERILTYDFSKYPYDLSLTEHVE